MTSGPAARRDILRARLAETTDRIARAADLAREPPPGEWSAREVVLHLVAVEQAVWQARLESLAGDPRPRWSWVEPGPWSGPGDRTFAGALRAFRLRRRETLRRLGALDAAAWARSGTHETLGELDVAGLLQVAIDHDDEHIAQVAALGHHPHPIGPA